MTPGQAESEYHPVQVASLENILLSLEDLVHLFWSETELSPDDRGSLGSTLVEVFPVGGTYSPPKRVDDLVGDLCPPLRSDLVEVLASGLLVLAETVGSSGLSALASATTVRGVRRRTCRPLDLSF